MTEPISTTPWAERELPVLRTTVDLFDADIHGKPNVGEVADRSGLHEEEVVRALRAMDQAGLISITIRQPLRTTQITAISGAARERLGDWPPTAEAAAQRMIDALERIVANTEDDEERTRVQKLIAALKNVGGKVLTSAIGAAVTGVLR